MRRWSLAILSLAVALSAPGQAPLPGLDPLAAAPTHATATTAVATRTPLAPELDGSDADPIWAQAQTIDAFRQFAPKEDGPATFRTEARIAYDDRYLFVFVRMYDPHPDSLVGLLSRRDQKSPSDEIKILVDSYHDKRSAYEFAVNPRGVKRDIYSFNDQEEDDSWDGVWDVATRIDSAGWTAEFRIPFDQLRFAPQAKLTMGLAIARDIARLNERDSWPVYRRSKSGISSQFGELSGIDGLGAPRHLEIVPYVVAKNITYPVARGGTDTTFERQQQFEFGGDLKYGVTSNITLDATVNPDFGQVESDPATLNLSNTETFLPERRPFFVEGTGIFRFDLNCRMHSCTGLFYSRRIGRQPQLSDGSAGTATATAIMGAAKLTGRTNGGFSVGFLDALTARELSGASGSTVEPATNYIAAQLVQEFRGGKTQLGVMTTAVNRQLDPDTRDYLRESAYTLGAHLTHLFADRQYQLQASLVGSRVSGSTGAMALTQASSTHYYQRPGSGLLYDTTLTTLSGDVEKISFGKIGGGIVRFNTNFSRFSPGFEINDLGYLAEAGVMSWNNNFSLYFQEAGSFYRQLYLSAGESNAWTSQGLSAEYMSTNSISFDGDIQFKNSWWARGGISFNRWHTAYDDRKARGGPALRGHPYTDAYFGIEGDPRLSAIPSVRFSAFDGSGGLSHGWSLGPSVLFRFSSSLALSLGLEYSLSVDYVNWLENLIHDTPTTDTIVTIATLHQNTASAIVRIDATFTPQLTLQFFAQPYLSSGRREHWRYVADPRAEAYSEEFKDYTPVAADSAFTPGTCQPVTVDCWNFNYQQLNVNAVLRWEYRPGSTLFVVWSHGRTYDNYDQQYSGYSPGTDANSLFAVHPMNTFLIKGSYWFSL